MGLMGHPVPDAYSADVLGEVEVIKGPASILYGTNAIGGVVNMKTKRMVTDGFKTRLRISAGNYDVKRLVVQNGGKYNKWDYYLTYGRRSTAGHRPHSAFSSSAYHMRLGYEINNNISISLVGKAVPFYMEDPGYEGEEEGSEYDIFRGDLTLSTYMDFSKIILDYQVFRNQGEHKISDGFHSTDFCEGFLLKNHIYLISNNSTTIGMDYKRYGGELIEVFKPSLIGKDFNVNELAVYTLSEQNIGSFKVSAGLRGEKHSIYGWVTVPHLGIVFNVNQKLTLLSSYGEGFRSPTIRELYLFPAPNELLQPEESNTIEFGANYKLNSVLMVSADYYYSSGENRIETVGVWPNQSLRNSGKYKYNGFETNIKYLPFSGMQITFNGSLFNSDNPVSNQPGMQMQLALNYHRKYFSVSGSVDYVGELKYFENGSYQTLPNYGIINFGCEAVPAKNLNLFVQIRNLNDVEYMTMIGYPMPGRTIETGLIYDF